MADGAQEKDGRGRPPFEPTKALRRRATILAAGGMSHEGIASAFGISEPTLRKYFADELASGANQKRAEVVEALFRAAKRGNVSAQRAFLSRAPEFAAPSPPDAPKEPKPVAVGKKEQAQADATTAQVGTEWGDLLPRPGHTPSTVQ